MQKTRDELQIQSEIRGKVNSKLGKNQREAILREQLRAIQDELGDLDETSSDGKKPDQYRQKITASQMPEAVRKTALDELRRLESMGNQSPETHVIRNYLDLLLALPWSMGEGDHANLESEIDLNKARQVLDDDHYGLDKIKKRIIEHLATMKLRPEKRGLILLFNGPPGVGKTSLGQSIAKALGRKFVRASLGGVRDDAEIRGHRRTYVGAMPGRIIQSLKRVGTVNPVFLLDEIDKLGRGYSGDPASALLEVLDPEQNATFTDHYLDVPYDLSKVLFIATANSLETIPGPLLDRMEVIELTGYTTNEKVHIAKSHLLPKELAEHGITSEQLTISDETLGKVIAQYTREAGVRDLQRKISALCRNVAIQIVEGKATVEVNDVLVEEALGASRFESEAAAVVMPPGVATGLAWTPVGGEILFIESALMPGHGKLSLTGQLGDVMKESAQIALTLVRSRLPAVSSKLDFEKNDVHIHVPAGAIPKDGPSAGVAILTSIASLFLGRAVDAKLAMTGEITLRGSVTPVGGIKEKVIAAHRAGMKRIILARRNERDLRDVPAEVRAGLEFIFADDVADVLRAALGLELAEMDQGTGLWNLATAVGIGSVAAGTAPESGAL
jgi:ATP-dependent Lon protease